MIATEKNSTSGIIEKFSGLFHEVPLLVRSPGRINIIGEHTDYNEGFVLPAAINQSAYIAITARDDDNIKLFSTDYNQPFDCSISSLKPTSLGWPNYVLGVADQLVKRGYSIKGFNLVLHGEVPIGAGLSSSASIECATVYALNELFDLRIEKLQMALIAQKAEHEFAKVMCGIMDQFASMFGKEDHVIRLDCRSLEYEYMPMKLEGMSIVLMNTNVKHSLSSSEYNTRRDQCEQGVAWVKERHPQVKTLRDVTHDMLNTLVRKRDEVIFKRCNYVVEENERLIRACEDLKAGDIRAVGKEMYRTHEGLSREYEVSCKELDFLVDAVKKFPEVLGARMMGGGFGGCTINIIKDEAIERITSEVGEAYSKQMKLDCTVYIAHLGNGTENIKNKK
jgi:galactokinase